MGLSLWRFLLASILIASPRQSPPPGRISLGNCGDEGRGWVWARGESKGRGRWIFGVPSKPPNLPCPPPTPLPLSPTKFLPMPPQLPELTLEDVEDIACDLRAGPKPERVDTESGQRGRYESKVALKVPRWKEGVKPLERVSWMHLTLTIYPKCFVSAPRQRGHRREISLTLFPLGVLSHFTLTLYGGLLRHPVATSSAMSASGGSHFVQDG